MALREASWEERIEQVKPEVDRAAVVTFDEYRSAFQEAARTGKVKVIELLLSKEGANPNSKDDTGRTPLLSAAAEGHEAVVQLLLAREGINVDSEDINGGTPLSWAVTMGHEPVAKLLLTADGVKPDSEDKSGRTPLSWAAGRGHKAIVDLLLANDSVDPNHRDKHNRTPLSWAAYRGHGQVVKLLLQRKDIDSDTRDDHDKTPLSWAAENGHVEVAQLFLEKGGIDVNSRDETGRTPLQWAAKEGHVEVAKLFLENDDVDLNSRDKYDWTPLLWATGKGHIGVIKLLLEKNIIELDSRDSNGRTPLSWAAGKGHAAIMLLLLEKTGIDLNSRDSNGRTPLSWAAGNGHAAIMQLLLEKDGIDLDLRDNNGRTPLSWAAGNGHAAIMQFLLEKNDVDPNSRDDHDRTPLLWAAEEGRTRIVKTLLTRDSVAPDPADKNGWTPLFWATHYEQLTLIETLLTIQGVDPDSRDENSRTPLSWASEKGYVAAVKLFLEKDGIDVDSRDERDWTPLLWAAKEGRVEVVKLLLKRNNIDLDSRDNSGRTPLSWAAGNGHATIMQLLLEKDGIDLNPRDNSGRTPLSWAAGNWHTATMQLLLEKDGIDLNSRDNSGRTPISWAAGNGYVMIMQLLLEKDGIDLNSRDNSGRTPISWAARNGHAAIMLLLLKKDGIDLNSRDNSGRTPISWAAGNGYAMIMQLLLKKDGIDLNSRDNNGQTSLSWAAENGHKVIMQLLLEKDGIDPDLRDNDIPILLSWAAKNGHKAMIQLLLEKYDVDPDLRDNDGRTLLSWAAGNGDKETMQLLLKKKSVNPDSRDNNGQTPLLWAAKEGHVGVVKLLLEKDGIDPDSRDNNGRTALHMATGNETVKLLRRELSSLRSRKLYHADLGEETGKSDPHNSVQYSLRFRQILEVLLAHGANVNAKDDKGQTPVHVAAAHGLMENLEVLLKKGVDITFEQQVPGDTDDVKLPDVVDPERALESGLPPITVKLMRALGSATADRASFNTKILLSWEILQCIQAELDNNFDLDPVLTITGGPRDACALPCGEYVKQWDILGAFVVKGVLQALREPGKRTHNLYTTTRGESYLYLSFLLAGDLAFVSISGIYRDILAVVEILSWLAATFRLPPEGAIHCSDVKITPMEMNTFVITLDNLYEAQNDGHGACWHSLFPNTVIANGFPIPPRDHEIGIQMPFDVMIDLAGIVYHVDLKDLGREERGIYFRGVTSILYPTSSNGTSIQWHLMSTGTKPFPPGYLQNLSWHRIESLELIKHATSFLGFCSDSIVHLGTTDRLTQYARMSPSGAQHEKPPPEVSMSSVPIGLSAAGYGNIGAIAGIKYRNGLTSAKPTENIQYDTILEVSFAQPVILFDTEAPKERGWLVPQLSVILELINYWIYTHGSTNYVHADLAADGGQAANAALSVKENANKILRTLIDDNSVEHVKDLVKKIYFEMGRREELNASSERYARGTLEFGHQKLLGWDLLELLNPPQRSSRREVAVHKTERSFHLPVTPCWLDLSHYFPVFFCQRLGEIITPAANCRVCEAWNPIPGGFASNYLVVNIPCLVQWSKREGFDDCCQIFRNLYWDFGEEEIFRDCTNCLGTPQNCPKKPQLLVRAGEKGYRPRRRFSKSKKSFVPQIYAHGAVVFGIRQTWSTKILGCCRKIKSLFESR